MNIVTAAPAVASLAVPGRVAKGRVSQFDGLRAWAIAGVFLTHYLMKHDDWWVVRLDPGYYAVRLFFVLSGFLITGILLGQKSKIASSKLTLGMALRLFYLRRMLRLSPVYYLSILAGTLFFAPIREHLLSFLLYTQNYTFVIHEEAFHSAICHLWTLAVEEQFYLAWPLFVFLCPARRLPVAIVCVLAAGGTFGLALSATGANRHGIALLLPTNLLTLGSGALVAVLGSRDYGNEALARRVSRLGLVLGPPLLVAGVLVDEAHIAYRLVLPLREAGSALFFSWMIGYLCTNVPAAARWALLSSPARYVGMISYAIYLFHMPLIDLLDNGLLPRIGLSPPDGWLRVAAYGGCAIGLAALSWHLLESRVSRLKDRVLKYG